MQGRHLGCRVLQTSHRKVEVPAYSLRQGGCCIGQETRLGTPTQRLHPLLYMSKPENDHSSWLYKGQDYRSDRIDDSVELVLMMAFYTLDFKIYSKGEASVERRKKIGTKIQKAGGESSLPTQYVLKDGRTASELKDWLLATKLFHKGDKLLINRLDGKDYACHNMPDLEAYLLQDHLSQALKARTRRRG